jgi:L-lactate dehydrogenase complex protein LldG
MNAREAILSRVNKSLAALPRRVPLPDWDDELIHMRDQRGEIDTLALFSQRFAALKGIIHASPSALADWLVTNNRTHGYCDPVLLQALPGLPESTLTIETTFDPTRVDDYDFGITLASGAIAETGTLIFDDRQTSRRLAALAPWVHIAALDRTTIHPDLEAAVRALDSDPNIIFCTGPSKTADVEGILIEGVHGPGIQHAILLPDNP